MTRFVLQAIKWLGLLALSLYVVNYSAKIISSGSDAFFAENMTLENPEDSSGLFEIHRLKKGKGIIIGYRQFVDPGFFKINDERYQKLTISLPEVAEKKEGIDFNNVNFEQARALYSEGKSSETKSGCHGEVKNLSVRVEESIWSDAKLSISGRLHGRSFEGKKCSIEFELTDGFDRIDFEDLNPWLGLKSENPFDETFRNNRKEYKGIDLPGVENIKEMLMKRKLPRKNSTE